MADLWWAVLVMIGATGAAFELTRRLSRGWTLTRLIPALAGAAGALVLFLRYVLDSVAMIRLIPLRNMVVLGNWTPVLAAIVAGLACNARTAGSMARRVVLGVALVMLSCYAAWAPVFLPSGITLDDSQRTAYWRQTSDASCAPAAAATLLNQFGIAATETEMARLCLTTARGTTNWGLYRGLRIKTDQTPFAVETVVGGADGVLACRTPVLMNSGVGRFAESDPAGLPGGWFPGINHSVVALGRDAAGRLAVVDPSVGHEWWDDDSVRSLYQGAAFVLRSQVQETGITVGVGAL